jgi:sugar/nucleoside kinase (ribokinase family)
VRFAAIGHVTNDHLAAGLSPGGSALYAALTAARLGLRAHAVTSHGPAFAGRALLDEAGVRVENVESPRTTTFVNRYQGGARSARVLEVAAPLTAPTRADIVLACPVIGEVAPSVLQGGLVGAGLQGWLRRLGPDGDVERHIPADVDFLRPCRAVFASVEDLGDSDLLGRLTQVAPIVVCTDGPRGAAIHAEGRVLQIAAYPTVEVDPTGAGDVFAAAFLIALARGEDLESAGIFAACAASIVVEAVGPEALSRLGETAARRARYNRG